MGKAYTPWGTLPPEQREEMQRAHRVRAKLRKLGKPSMVPAEPAIRRVRLLHDECGMSFQAIAEAAGVGRSGRCMAQSSVSDLYRGYRHDPHKPLIKIHRDTADRVMSIPHPGLDSDSRALVDATGTRRRMQALCAAGYGSKFQATYLGQGAHQYTWRFMRGTGDPRYRYTHVTVTMREAVRGMYAKLAEANPVDHGVPAGEVTKCRNVAVRRGYAPVHCWDEDTIDDPDAYPEWTGQCGTMMGYRIHYRENMLPVCLMCKKSRSIERRWPNLARIMGISVPLEDQ